MRSCIGVRSCASSTITCPNARGALREQRARLVDQRDVVRRSSRSPPSGRRRSRCSRSSRIPSAASASRAGAVRSERTRPSGAIAGQTRSSQRGRNPFALERALDLGEVAPREPAEPRPVVLVEAAQDVHPEALARLRRQPELARAALEQLRDLALADADVLALHARDELLRVRAPSAARRRARSPRRAGRRPSGARPPARRRPSPRPRRRARRPRAARRSPRRASAGRARRTP